MLHRHTFGWRAERKPGRGIDTEEKMGEVNDTTSVHYSHVIIIVCLCLFISQKDPEGFQSNHVVSHFV